jgi:acyl-CoA synthetase (AMP-forming)/AMP-acid ligase II
VSDLALIPQMLAGWAARTPLNAAVLEDERRVTWQALEAQVTALASGMAAHGIAQGDVVGMLARDRLEVLVHLLACLRLGAVRVGINSRYAPREVLHVIRDCDARMIIVEDGLVELLDRQEVQLHAEGRVMVVLGAPDAPALREGFSLDYRDLLHTSPAMMPSPCPEDLAIISYTSGSTGMPKGVLLTQRAIATTVAHLVLLIGLSQDDVWFQAASLAWYSCVLALLGMVNGMAVVLPGRGGSFDAAGFLDIAGERGVTATMLVPTMIGRVLDEMDTRQTGAPSLRRLCYGSAPTPHELQVRARAALPGVRLMQFYGVTEGGFATVLTHADHLRGFAGESDLLTSCGRPGPRAEVQIMDENSELLKRGERGEVWLRSEMNCGGYHSLPTETSLLLSAGWVRTNDIGWMDDEGFLYLTDRKNFVIITGGMNVYPSAVERVLSEHPMVSEAAVVGVEHGDWGQAVVALVVARPGCAPDPVDLIAFSRERLGSFQVPKFIKVVPTLPRGATGKVSKPAIMADFLQNPRQLPWVCGRDGMDTSRGRG